MSNLLDLVSHYLQDGRPRKLIHIVNAVKAMGWIAGPSSQYISVYHTLRNHPELFKRIEKGIYQMTCNQIPKNNLDNDQIRELIYDYLKKAKKASVAQVWRMLQDQGVVVTYNATQHLLQSDMFTKDGYSRYSNET